MPTDHVPASTCGDTHLSFVDGPRPIVFEETGQRTIREESATRLAAGTIVTFVFRVDDSLNGCPTDRTRLPEATVNRHLGPKGGDLLRKVPFRLLAQTIDPEVQGVARRIVQPD